MIKTKPSIFLRVLRALCVKQKRIHAEDTKNAEEIKLFFTEQFFTNILFSKK